MKTPIQTPVVTVPGYYTYQPRDAGFAIHLSLEALDGMLAEIMTGFGAIPRRGAEVGGILLGRFESAAIWIESFAMVTIEHRRGPSYLLSEKDQREFSETFDQNRQEKHYPVGLFRSNTREVNQVGDEDRDLFRHYFPPPQGAFLLVRPFATKTSQASFLIYRDGELPAASDESFPFLRWELEGGAAPARRPLLESKPRGGFPRSDNRGDDPKPESRASRMVTTPLPEDIRPEIDADELNQPGPAYTPSFDLRDSKRSRTWLPLSFMFLVIGLLLGFLSAMLFYPHSVNVDSFPIGLTASSKNDNLYIRWNREAPAIRSAQGGRLEIQDGKYIKNVELDASSLQTGSVVYPPLSPKVTLRLQLAMKGTTSVVETVDWAKGE